MPRTEIVAWDTAATIEELRSKFIETGLSKILVYNENIDDIIGYIHSSELFKNPEDWTQHIRSVSIVPETMAANKLMKLLMQEKKSLAVVVDEFGGTSGIVTLEDLVEEIFGEIEDEHDMKSHVAKKVSDNEYLLSGRMEIDTLNEMFGLDLPESDDYVTIAGFILHLLCLKIGIQQVIEAVVTDAMGENSHFTGEVLPAERGIGVIKPQRLTQWGETVARHGPVGDLIMNGLRAHIVDVLGVVLAIFRFRGTDELAGLKNNVPQAAFGR